MLSFRQIASVAWTFLAFMVAAALVLNMRYKPLEEDNALYLDTWTGKVHSKVAEVAAPKAREAAVTVLESSRNGVDILLLEELVERRAKRHKHDVACSTVRFAFPVPGSRLRGR